MTKYLTEEVKRERMLLKAELHDLQQRSNKLHTKMVHPATPYSFVSAHIAERNQLSADIDIIERKIANIDSNLKAHGLSLSQVKHRTHNDFIFMPK